MRLKARVDANHAKIKGALSGVGAVVTDLSRVGRGVSDLLVSYRKQWFVLEIKDGSKPPSARKLTSHQVAWKDKQHAPVYVVTSEAEALIAIGAVASKTEHWPRWL